MEDKNTTNQHENYETFLNPNLPIPKYIKILLPIIACGIGYLIWLYFIQQ